VSNSDETQPASLDTRLGARDRQSHDARDTDNRRLACRPL
jgi:hypothetical protein